MRLSVDFPSVMHRGGPAVVAELIAAIEQIGFDDLAMFDYVVMGYGTDDRAEPPYPAKSPFLESLVTLSFAAALTTLITLSTNILKLPQRQAALVAKQAGTLDLLAGGRLRLGVGVGWQEAEYDALGESFADRGERLNESIALLRACWGHERIDLQGARFDARAVAMEPKPPRGEGISLWIGGGGPAALRRAATLGDGWMAGVLGDDELQSAVREVRRYATEAGRSIDDVQLQAPLEPPPHDRSAGTIFQDLDVVERRAEWLHSCGFGWLSVNATSLYVAGARTVPAMVDALSAVHDRLRSTVG